MKMTGEHLCQQNPCTPSTNLIFGNDHVTIRLHAFSASYNYNPGNLIKIVTAFTYKGETWKYDAGWQYGETIQGSHTKTF